MRVVLQIVKNASVTIEEKLYSQINEGFLLLVGFNNEDNEEVTGNYAIKLVSGLLTVTLD